MLRVTPPDQVQAAQERLRARFFAPEREAPLANTTTVRQLGRVTHLEFRGRLYQVPPVPYPEGLLVQKLMQDWRQAAQARDLDAQRRANDRAATVFHRLVRPVGRWRRMWWPLLANPFHQASEEEMGELFLFFFACRTKSTVRPLSTND